jgi:hypothetical protein
VVRGLGAGGFAFGLFSFSVSVRGLGTSVDVRVAALNLFVLSAVPCCLGGSVVGSCGA